MGRRSREQGASGEFAAVRAWRGWVAVAAALGLVLALPAAGVGVGRAQARAASRARPTPEAVFVVSTTHDAGPGSLRAAIDGADRHAGPDRIEFAIRSGPQEIAPLSVLPVITDPVAIDATTQPGYAGLPLIRLDGAHAGGLAASMGGGIRIRGDSSVIRGLALTNWFAGVSVTGGRDNVIAGDYLGTDGVHPLGNVGVFVHGGARDNVVGGQSRADRNLISGDQFGNGFGVRIAGTGTTGNVVEGNYIGTTRSGGASLGNRVGVVIQTQATGNTIGGTVTGTRNVISGNRSGDGVGIVVGGVGTRDNRIEGNYIGTDPTGRTSVSNIDGMLLYGGTSHNTVGGTQAGARNVVSGNTIGNGVGVGMADDDTEDNLVVGNYVGTDATGEAPLPNNVGVSIYARPVNNVVGGTTPAARNVISGNTTGAGLGVELSDPGTDGNRVEGNEIGTDAAGMMSLPNRIGVDIFDATTHNVVGGTSPGAGNVISGNTAGPGDGITISGTGTTGNAVYGNAIGLNRPGTDVLGNGQDGVEVLRGATGNVVGGPSAGMGNRIVGNGTNGVQIDGAGTDGISVLGNAITGNARIGIALSDGGDRGEPTPVVTWVSTRAGTTTIAGTASDGRMIEVFSNPSCDHAQAQTSLGLATASSGRWVLRTAAVPAGLGVTASATSGLSDTSQLSACVTAGPPARPESRFRRLGHRSREPNRTADLAGCHRPAANPERWPLP